MVCSCKTPGGQGLKERTANQASLVRAGTHVEGRIRRVKFANDGGFDHDLRRSGQNRRHLQTPPSRSPFARGPFRETAVESGPRSRSGHSSGRRRPSSRSPSRLHLRHRPATPSRPAPKRHSSSQTERPSSRYARTYVSTSPIAFFGRAFLISIGRTIAVHQALYIFMSDFSTQVYTFMSEFFAFLYTFMSDFSEFFAFS